MDVAGVKAALPAIAKGAIIDVFVGKLSVAVPDADVLVLISIICQVYWLEFDEQ